VNDAEAALLRNRDGQARVGDRIHRRREQRDVERDRAGEAGCEGNVAGNDAGVGGNEQDVVESQRLAHDTHRTLLAQKPIIPAPRDAPTVAIARQAACRKMPRRNGGLTAVARTR